MKNLINFIIRYKVLIGQIIAGILLILDFIGPHTIYYDKCNLMQWEEFFFDVILPGICLFVILTPFYNKTYEKNIINRIKKEVNYFGKRLNHLINKHKFNEIDLKYEYCIDISAFWEITNVLNDMYKKCILLINKPGISSKEYDIINIIISRFNTIKLYNIDYKGIELNKNEFFPNFDLHPGEIFGGEIIIQGSMIQWYKDIYDNILMLNFEKNKDNDNIISLWKTGFLHKDDGIIVNHNEDYICTHCKKSATTNLKKGEFKTLSKCECGHDTYFKIKIPDEIYLINNNNL